VKVTAVIDSVRALYLTQFKKYGIDNKSLFWPKGRQRIRFEQHLSMLENSKKRSNETLSILDYGCGFSDLYEYIINANISVSEYIGVDILDEFLQVGKKKFNQNNYYTRDFFCSNIHITADLIVASGTFNIRYFNEYEKNYKFLLSEITMLSKRAKSYISFDFMTDQVDYMNINAFHISPARLERDLKENFNFRKVQIIKSKIPYEFLGQIWI
jgi:SAM-dependent methyltransferase